MHFGSDHSRLTRVAMQKMVRYITALFIQQNNPVLTSLIAYPVIDAAYNEEGNDLQCTSGCVAFGMPCRRRMEIIVN